MAAKTSSSVSLKTLRGVFEEPKMNHRRDFLRENKLNLRELQKSTTQKLTHQKEEEEKKRYKHIEKFQKTREPSSVRRSASQCRNAGGGEGGGFVRQSSSITAGANEAMKTKTNCKPHRREASQQRQHKSSVQPTCCCSQQRQQAQCELQYREHVPRSARSASVSSKTESCDKEIQTEDIHDEDFLYAALKKCSNSEVRKLPQQKSIDHLNVRDKNIQQTNPNYGLQQHHETESTFSYLNNQMYPNHTHFESENAENGYLEQCTTRSQNSHITNGHIQNYNSEKNTEHEKYIAENLENQFQNLNVDRQSKPDVDQQSLSARSRQTQCSTTTKRRAKLGCREDLNLPRYLEKEKREKEEELLREMSRDPNCPSGHYALSEEDRLKALHAAQQKINSLINELNHLPMTTQTLRVRNRKADIEKELAQIEMDIRLYSKPKVYVAESLPLPQD